MTEHRVGPARPDEFGRLADIEAAADELFATAGVGPLPPSNPDSDALGTALHLIVVGDPAYGFARIDEACGHFGRPSEGSVWTGSGNVS